MADKLNDLQMLGEKISICRQNKNMTQETLAGKLGITPQALSKWERGMSLPDVSMLADLARILEVSVDWLLGLELPGAERKSGTGLQESIGNFLRNSLEPLELKFGVGLTTVWVEDNNGFVEIVDRLRCDLAKQGTLMPIVRIMDDNLLKDEEFMVLAYQNVLYSEIIENPDEKTVEYIIGKLGDCVREKYYEIISPDLVKLLVDNLKIKYPALIEGVVPEKISYGLLTEILRKHLKRGNGACYLPKIIEIVECALREKPNLSATELEEQVAKTICRPDNLWLVLKERK